MRKAQTEMMGLVILVLIISIVAIFGIRFLFSSKEEVGPEIKLQTQANNLQNALNKLDIDGKSLSEVSRACCDGDCKFFDKELSNIIDSVLPSQKYEFQLSNDQKTCFSTKSICNQRVSSTGRIVGDINSYNIVISLCF